MATALTVVYRKLDKVGSKVDEVHKSQNQQSIVNAAQQETNRVYGWQLWWIQKSIGTPAPPIATPPPAPGQGVHPNTGMVPRQGVPSAPAPSGQSG